MGASIKEMCVVGMRFLAENALWTLWNRRIWAKLGLFCAIFYDFLRFLSIFYDFLKKMGVFCAVCGGKIQV